MVRGSRQAAIQRDDPPIANRLPIRPIPKETTMSLSLLLIIVLVLLLIGALPSWGYSRSWGYRPMGGLGLILIIVVVLMLMGRI